LDSDSVWRRDPQEAHDNPYEYDAQEQFASEAKAFLKKMADALDSYNMKFDKDDTRLEKATWMLLQDLVDSLNESLSLINEKRHRVAVRLFRDAVETIDLLKLLHSNAKNATAVLEDWFNDNCISHTKSRSHIKDREGESAQTNRSNYYAQLSKFTHRTYHSLLDSYTIGRGDKLVHDSHSSSDMLVPPETISYYYAVLGNLIIMDFLLIAHLGGIIKKPIIAQALLGIFKKESVPRRFEVRRTKKNNEF